MKVENLRIGNKIGFYKPLANELQIGTVMGIMVDNEEGILIFVPEFSRKVWLNIQAIKPLNLTEDWLLKFGFEVSYSSNYRLKLDHAKHAEIGFDFSKTPEKTIEGFRYYGQYVKKEFVHEVQNLFNDLISEELVLQD